MGSKKNQWWIYIVRCSDGSFYTGMTLDIRRRVGEHNEGPRGARYTRLHRPVVLIYQEGPFNRVTAMKREIQIKQLPKKRKEDLVRTAPVIFQASPSIPQSA